MNDDPRNATRPATIEDIIGDYRSFFADLMRRLEAAGDPVHSHQAMAFSYRHTSSENIPSCVGNSDVITPTRRQPHFS